MFNLNGKALYQYLKDWLRYLLDFFRLCLTSNYKLRMEVIALRSQLSLYEHHYETHNLPKPKSSPAFRQLWVLLSKYLPDWKSIQRMFKPDTIIKWHRTAFSVYWAKKSQKKGRPQISRDTINLIERVHKENPLLSPEKIHEKLKILGLKSPPAPNTIAKYFPDTRKSPTQKQIQSWKTFLNNHQSEIWGTDFLTIPTLKFEVLYVLVIIHHKTRKIIHYAVTKNPNAEWLKQQFRNATPFDQKPKYLIHDNDPVFRSKEFQAFLRASGIQSKGTSFHSPWQNPYAERVNGTLRRELLDHIIPLNENHLERLLKEYIDQYYNTERTHQGINDKTPVPSPEYIPIDAENIKLKATPILNGLYHKYNRVA
ncbi:integrase core domain-containing protein [Salinibacillus aidingensis]|uniref:Integrase core domain-containing protein n=1 Tax=Salinibacillus aidingensis TaxID=237684 RepID=A0ABP3KTS6_9BACI